MTIPCLTTLDLSNNDITNKSIPMVTYLMSHVGYLSLSGNRISSDGAKKLIAKAEELLDTTDADEQSSCHLQRIWLGDNIEEYVFAECSCTIISSELLTIKNIQPCKVPAMFSSLPVDSSHGQHGPCLIPRKDMYLPIMGTIHNMLLSEVFNDFVLHAIRAHDSACFNRWFMSGVHAVVHHRDCDNPVEEAKCLLNLFVYLANWNFHTGAHYWSVPVLCFMICVIDELILVHRIHELLPRAESTLQLIMQECAKHSDTLFLMVQFMSGLAEHCNRRKLHSVAECLLQQMEYMSQQAWRIMKTRLSLHKLEALN